MSKPNYSFIIQHVKAPNDRNGNPRRCYVVYGDIVGDLLAVYDEGYQGRHAMPEFVREGFNMWLEPVNVSASEYKRFLKLAPAIQP
jgi:hypothetical protein